MTQWCPQSTDYDDDDDDGVVFAQLTNRIKRHSIGWLHEPLSAHLAYVASCSAVHTDYSFDQVGTRNHYWLSNHGKSETGSDSRV